MLVDSYTNDIKKLGQVTIREDIELSKKLLENSCNWDNDWLYISENYDFYHSLSESRESKELEFDKAIEVYRTFRDIIYERLSEAQKEYVVSQSFMQHPIPLQDKKEITTSFLPTSVIPVYIDLKEYGFTSKQGIYFTFDKHINARALCTYNGIIKIKSIEINGHISIDTIKTIFEIPDIIIHEIIHALDAIRSKSNAFIQSGLPYQRKLEIHAYTHNLIMVLNDLMSHGWRLDSAIFTSRKNMIDFIVDIAQSDYRKILAFEVLNQLYQLFHKISDNNFRIMMNDIIDYYQGLYTKHGSINNIK